CPILWVQLNPNHRDDRDHGEKREGREDVSALQSRMEAMAGEFGGTAGVAALNLTTGEEVAVNEGASFPTASMIKILVLFELVRQCAKGQAQMWERVTLRNADKTLGSGLLLDVDEGANLTLRDLAVL